MSQSELLDARRNGRLARTVPDPEVRLRAKHLHFTAEYKQHITKLRGPVTWTYYYLYVMLDVYSRYVVGWLIADRESEVLAQELIQQTCAKQGIQPGQLTIHADNGSAMISKSVAQLPAPFPTGVWINAPKPSVTLECALPQ